MTKPTPPSERRRRTPGPGAVPLVASAGVSGVLGAVLYLLLTNEPAALRVGTSIVAIITAAWACAAAAWLGAVTDRARAAQAMQERAASFRLLFERNPHPMAVYDRETLAFLEVNGAAVRHYGYSRREFLQMGILDLCEPADAEALAAYLAEDLDSEEGAMREPVAWQHRLKSGELIDAEITASKLEF